MSSNLYWEHPVKSTPLSDEFKFALRKLHGETVNRVFTIADVPMLEGMAIAGSEEIEKDANALIKAIHKYDEITVRETW